ncbi:MAG: DegV family protein [Clostridia bacterium]|nr:DegV family protein [Clostridia bacterium]MBQ6891694.1 DegV family protein [Clostridia bacterium]
MSYTVFTDAASNLPGKYLRELDIRPLPCTYTMEGREHTYLGDIDAFDAPAYYDKLRAGVKMKTSLLNSHLFESFFRPELEKGLDVVYVGMSSGISGTFQAARMAAEELRHEFPGRTVHTVDSLGAGFGPGLLAVRAAQLRREGRSAAEAGAILDAEVMHTLNFFTVDDLDFLKATGRVSGATAAIGTVLSIKPILWGDTMGHITAKSKVRGRKKSLEALAELYRAHLPEEGQVDMVFISHGDCPEDAEVLAQKIRAIHEPRELTVCPHEPFTGSHVGPGMLALFFQGKHR